MELTVALQNSSRWQRLQSYKPETPAKHNVHLTEVSLIPDELLKGIRNTIFTHLTQNLLMAMCQSGMLDGSNTTATNSDKHFLDM